MQQTANTAQAQSWNGYEGTHWAAHHDRWNVVNAGFNEPLMATASIRPGEHVLDIGCGAGATTRLAARAAEQGYAAGLDLSGPMLEQARTVAAEEGITNISFTRGDAQVHDLPRATFDVAMSRFGIMFFSDPVAAFANIASALRPGGRIAFLSAAEPEGNEWLTALTGLKDILPIGGFGAPGGPGMFSLADPDTATGLFRAAGLRNVRAEHIQAHGTWGRTAQEAADFLLDSGPGRHLLSSVDPAARARARRRLIEDLGAHETGGAVRLRSTGWLLTASVGA
ncbi:methyltransferase domain-containing protein [Streptomyces sp. NBC_00320]|uniref:class I SAM-dependent methyltransferase n=1 Tax=Streptomyces sp. NBC_00320 TaxID=2975711 RepID=UPI00225A98C9|nr:methyltransferase domain-containing protein [Streptomyces sp. NBC_00320]MCX5149116.1 methyltransferase domain-containing protein [Streptomyces sp. NBC_00320]